MIELTANQAIAIGKLASGSPHGTKLAVHPVENLRTNPVVVDMRDGEKVMQSFIVAETGGVTNEDVILRKGNDNGCITRTAGAGGTGDRREAGAAPPHERGHSPD